MVNNTIYIVDMSAFKIVFIFEILLSVYETSVDISVCWQLCHFLLLPYSQVCITSVLLNSHLSVMINLVTILLILVTIILYTI